MSRLQTSMAQAISLIREFFNDFFQPAFDRFDFDGGAFGWGGWFRREGGGLLSGRRWSRQRYWFFGLRLGFFGFGPRKVPGLFVFQPGLVAPEGPHAVLGAGFDLRRYFEKITVADKGAYSGRRSENFAFRDANLQVGPVAQSLANDRQQTIGELRADSTLHFGGKGGHHALKRLCA